MRNILIAILLTISFGIESSEIFHSPSVPQVIWDAVNPYLMAANHPAKPALDMIFSNPKVIQNRQSMQQAGFKMSKPRKWDNIFIATHKKLKGYVLKLYIDEQGVLPDWYNWVKRVQGSIVIRKAIIKHHYEHFFSVPKKWIYPLPRIAEKPEHKSFILVVEDMNLLNESDNEEAWKSTKQVTKEKLTALYTLLKEEGLIDSVYIDNIPFSKDRHIAFIDTEHFHRYDQQVNFSRLESKLPKKLRNFWKQLTKS